MSDVVVLSVARGESSAREFVHKLTTHHSQTPSTANESSNDAIAFELVTKYYRVTLRLRCHDYELTSSTTTTTLASDMMFGYPHMDALRSEVDALLILMHA
jgi:hypothetical protein